jgi:hypothetical protein
MKTDKDYHEWVHENIKTEYPDHIRGAGCTCLGCKIHELIWKNRSESKHPDFKHDCEEYNMMIRFTTILKNIQDDIDRIYVYRYPKGKIMSYLVEKYPVFRKKYFENTTGLKDYHKLYDDIQDLVLKHFDM